MQESPEQIDTEQLVFFVHIARGKKKLHSMTVDVI